MEDLPENLENLTHVTNLFEIMFTNPIYIPNPLFDFETISNL